MDVSRSKRRETCGSPILMTRTRSGSEAIRERVNQLLNTAAMPMGASPEPLGTSTSQDSQTSFDSVDSFIPSSAALSYPVKTKKPSKSETKSMHPEPPLSRKRLSPEKYPRSPTYHHAGPSTNFTSNGPNRPSEFERLRKEIQTLTEALHETKKANKRNNKRLEEAKTELNDCLKVIKDKDTEISTLKSKISAEKEVLSAIESAVQCQICMDLPERPFALAPCGHVLCLPCLQEWFSKAPPSTNDADVHPDELTDPHYVLMRAKSCPSCRTAVRHRPVQVFMVKAVANTLQKRQASQIPQSSAETPTESPADPWKGIFPTSDEEPDDAEDDDAASSIGDSGSDSDIVSELRSAVNWYRGRQSIFHSAHSPGTSEDEHQDFIVSDSDDDVMSMGAYTRPGWAPASVTINPQAFDLSQEQDPMMTLDLLRRGCSLGMIQNHDLAYSNSAGIVLSLQSLDGLYVSNEGQGGTNVSDAMNRIFLGWNIQLDSGDQDGDHYISDILRDIKRIPEQWLVTPRTGMRGAMDVRRLIPTSEDYDSTDSDTSM